MTGQRKRIMRTVCSRMSMKEMRKLAQVWRKFGARLFENRLCRMIFQGQRKFKQTRNNAKQVQRNNEYVLRHQYQQCR
jgi:hypothetical protein